MKKFTFNSFIILLFLLQTAVTHGQTAVFYPITVNEAKNLSNNSWVIISGNIINMLPGGKYYTFRDTSGEIIVEIERNVWRGMSVEPTDTVTISGKLEVKRGQVTVDVKAITGSGRINTRPGHAVTITQPITVNEAKNLPKNSWVILTGNIVQNIRQEYFLFRDSTGEITVEIERNILRGLRINPNERVEIHGYIEIEKKQISIDVKAIRVI